MTRALAFTDPAVTWLDRLPLGNGRLGAMVGAEHGRIRIGLNESSAWSGSGQSAERGVVSADDAHRAREHARAFFDLGHVAEAEAALQPLQHRYAQSFLPVGELDIEFAPACGEHASNGATAGEPVLENRRLLLADGVHEAEHAIGAVRVSSMTSAALAGDVVIHEVTASAPISVRIRFATSLRVVDEAGTSTERMIVLHLPADAAPSHEPDEPAVTWRLPGIDPVHVVVRIAVTHHGEARTSASQTATSQTQMDVSGATFLRIAVAIETTFGGFGALPGTGANTGANTGADTRANTGAHTGAKAVAGAVAGAVADAASRARRLTDEAPEAGSLGAHRRAHAQAHDAVQLTLGGDDAPGPAASTPRASPAERVGTPGGATVESDPELLALLFDYGRYLLRASSRSDGPPAHLQGIWNAEMQPPWSSDYTLNINTPMNYWGAEAVGESASHLALLNLLEVLAATGSGTAARLYGAGGWVAHHNTDLWGYSLPTRGGAEWALWPMGGAWLVRQFDEHRRYGAMSAETLERFWPVARGCAEFLLDFSRREGAHLQTFPSTSPENTYRFGDGSAAVTRSSALDRALLRDVFETVEQLGELLGRSGDRVVQRCREARPLVEGPRLTASGTVQEWGIDAPPTDVRHRHLSHLYPWFPGAEPLGDSGDGMTSAVIATLDERTDDSTGWSLVWKIALWARIGDGARVERLLNLFLRPASDDDGQRGGLYPNLFAAHPPFQVDGNLGLVGALAEVFVQSHRPGRIDLLRGLPPSLRAGSLRGLRARPGICVDLDWSQATVRRVSLRALTPGAAGALVVVAHAERRLVDVPFGEAVTIDWPSPTPR